jgi:hypothetical protein
VAQRVVIAHQHDYRGQIRGFISLRCSINADFSFSERSMVHPVQSSNESHIRQSYGSIQWAFIKVVLSGNKSHASRWVDGEVEEGAHRGNGLLGSSPRVKVGQRH